MRSLLLIGVMFFAGCGATLRNIEGGKSGYIVLERGGKDRAVLYCTDPASGVITCKEVWRDR